MHSSVRHNRRLFAVCISLLILLMAGAPRDAWRCLDGRLCPMGGPAAHGVAAPVASAASDHPTGSLCCMRRASAPTGSPRLSSPGMQCVLRHADLPAARTADVAAPDLCDAPATLPARIQMPASPLLKMAVSRSADVLNPPEPLAFSSDRAPPALFSALA